VRQTQTGSPFILPLTVDIYAGGRTQRYPATLRHAVDTLYFPAATKPNLVNVDAEKALVWQKKDNKSLTEYAYQYHHAPRYLDRREALTAAQAQLPAPLAQKTLVTGLTDKSPFLRSLAIEGLDLKNNALRKAATPMLAKLAEKDSSVQVRAAALTALGSLQDKRYTKLFTQALESKSYRVQGAALSALLPLNPKAALARATTFEADNKGALTVALVNVYGNAGGPAQWPLVLAKFDAAENPNRYDMMPGFVGSIRYLDDLAAQAQGITRIKNMGIELKSYGVDKRMIELLRDLQKHFAARPTATQTTALLEQTIAEIQAAK